MIIGHRKIVEDLKKLADGGRLSHAYLFHGPSMTGKRLVSLALANYLERGEFAEPEKILQDSLLISPGESGSIGIDEVRRLKDFLWQKPAASSRRTLIMDSAERMTEEAQNAILKIAEEPPASSLLLLVASDIESLRGTITSRLAKIYFPCVPKAEISRWLEKELNIKKAEAEKLTASSIGKPGLAWALKNDKKLQELLRAAEEFLSVSPLKRRDFIKKLIEPEDFSLPEFLSALILLLAMGREKREASVWHKVLSLRGRVANFALNPRLQLENLLS